VYYAVSDIAAGAVAVAERLRTRHVESLLLHRISRRWSWMYPDNIPLEYQILLPQDARDDTAPLGAAPLGAAPLGAAPLGAAPLGAAPLGAEPLTLYTSR
jgi:hypothetical protein